MNNLQKFNLSKECHDLVSGKVKKKKLSHAFRVEQWTAYLFVLIPMLGFTIFIFYVIIIYINFKYLFWRIK